MFSSKEELDEIFGAEDGVAAMVIALCATMFDNGVRIVHIGGLMRMLGVPNEDARKFDDQAFELSDNFYEQLEEMGFEKIDESELHLSQTIH